ncbi:hypothetical protein NDU88_001261, partial [Pleurodeles waltl]
LLPSDGSFFAPSAGISWASAQSRLCRDSWTWSPCSTGTLVRKYTLVALLV